MLPAVEDRGATRVRPLPGPLAHVRRRDNVRIDVDEETTTAGSDMSRARATRAVLEEAYAAGVQMQKSVQLPIAGAALASLAVGLFMSFGPGERENVVRQTGYLVMIVGAWLTAATMLPSDRHMPRFMATIALAAELIVVASDLHDFARYVERWTLGTLPMRSCPHYFYGASISPRMCWWVTHIYYVRILRSFIDSIVGVCACSIVIYLLARPTPARVLRHCYCSVVRYMALTYTLTGALDRLSAAIMGTIAIHNLIGPEAERIRATGYGPLAKHTDRLFLARVTVQLAICIFAMSPVGIRRLQSFLASRGHKVVLASAVSALIAGRPAEQVHRQALRTFRGIRADALKPEHLRAGALDALPYAESKRMAIGEVDVFVSHSVSSRPRPPRPLRSAAACRTR